MAAATNARPHHRKGSETLSLPAHAAVKLFDGSMAAVLMATANAGHVVPAASVGTAQKVLGLVRVFETGSEAVDNTAGANGDVTVHVETSPAWIAQDGTIAQDDWGQVCFATDDQTVALTGTHRAGVIIGVDANLGVLVDFLRKPFFTPITVANTTTDGVAAAAADLAALKAEAEKIGDLARATHAALVVQGILA